MNYTRIALAFRVVEAQSSKWCTRGSQVINHATAVSFTGLSINPAYIGSAVETAVWTDYHGD